MPDRRKPLSIVVVTGAAGAGKTATVAALASRNVPGVRCFHVDTIGVPTADEMAHQHGPDQWQAWATYVVLLDCAPDVRAARLCGPRAQPELANDRMDSWAAYLRGRSGSLSSTRPG